MKNYLRKNEQKSKRFKETLYKHTYRLGLNNNNNNYNWKQYQESIEQILYKKQLYYGHRTY